MTVHVCPQKSAALSISRGLTIVDCEIRRNSTYLQDEGERGQMRLSGWAVLVPLGRWVLYVGLRCEA